MLENTLNLVSDSGSISTGDLVSFVSNEGTVTQGTVKRILMEDDSIGLSLSDGTDLVVGISEIL